MKLKQREGPAEVSFTVPLIPPSVNNYVRHTRKGRHYVTKEAKAFKAAMGFFAKSGSFDKSPVDVRIRIWLRKGQRGDADNFSKCVLDGLVSAGVLLSDSQVKKVTVEKDRDWQNPRTEITVRAIWAEERQPDEKLRERATEWLKENQERFVRIQQNNAPTGAPVSEWRSPERIFVIEHLMAAFAQSIQAELEQETQRAQLWIDTTEQQRKRAENAERQLAKAEYERVGCKLDGQGVLVNERAEYARAQGMREAAEIIRTAIPNWSQDAKPALIWGAAFIEASAVSERAAEAQKTPDVASGASDGWIKVSERLPELGKKVDVCGSKRLDRGMAYLNEHGEWLIETCSDTINIYPPTHWRELPKPPEEP